MIVAVWDPGLRHLGLTLGADGRLLWAMIVHNPVSHKVRGKVAWQAMAQAARVAIAGMPIGAVAYEKPQKYNGQSRTNGAEDDLDELVGINGELSAVLAPRGVKRFAYLPHEWKRNLPKHVTINRILGLHGAKALLSSEEIAMIQTPKNCPLCPKILLEDVLDSVGIFLHFSGRQVF